MRKGWTITAGTADEMERQRIEKWRLMAPQQRLDAMWELWDRARGADARRLQRVYRVVEVD